MTAPNNPPSQPLSEQTEVQSQHRVNKSMTVPGADGLRFHADRRMAVQRGSKGVHVVAYACHRRRPLFTRRTLWGSRRSFEPAARCGLECHHGDQPRG